VAQSPALAHDGAGPHGDRLDLKAWLSQVAIRHNLPALAVVVVSAEGAARCALHGPLVGPGSAALGQDSVMRWYSLTKPVTASMIMCLVQRGVLTLATKAGAVLPELARSLGDATVEDLLCHRAGFADWQVDAACWFRDAQSEWPAPRQALADVLGRRRRHRVNPRRALGQARYSNLGYAVLGELAAQAAGQPYRQLVSDLILDPLGMSGTGFAVDRAPGASTEPVALSPANAPVGGHVRVLGSMGLVLRLFPGSGFLGRRDGLICRTRPREILFSPHGGLVGPARDLAPFLALHLGHCRPDGREPLLSPSSLLEMRRSRARRGGSRGEHMGLGWVLTHGSGLGREVEVCRHGGRGPGFSTEMMVIPAWGLALAVLTNVDGDAQALCRALLARGRDQLQALADSGARP